MYAGAAEEYFSEVFGGELAAMEAEDQAKLADSTPKCN